MKTIEEVTAEVKSVLESKRYCLDCQYSGSRVPDIELDRANAHGETQLKNISDADILGAFTRCHERESEDNSITAYILYDLAEKGFSTPYDNISFVVNIW